MIEFCTRKRMAIAIVVLVSLSVLTLIAEGMWSTHHKIAEAHSSSGSNQSCPSGKEQVIEECKACTQFERSSATYCKETGKKEVVKCQPDGPQITRSCKDDPRIAERKFWLLELVTLVIGMGSFGVVRYRQSKLDRLLMDKVNRQIAA